MAVPYPDLVGRGEELGEQDRVVERHVPRPPVGGVVGEGHSHQFGLGPVDQMAQDQPTAPAALAECGVAALPAAAAGRDGRHDHLVTGTHVVDVPSDLQDLADGLVPEDRPGLHLREVAPQDAQVTAADGGGVDAYDRVGRLLDRGVRDGVPGALPRAVVDERSHDTHFLASPLHGHSRGAPGQPGL